jgi:hypothetical protein
MPEAKVVGWPQARDLRRRLEGAHDRGAAGGLDRDQRADRLPELAQALDDA